MLTANSPKESAAFGNSAVTVKTTALTAEQKRQFFKQMIPSMNSRKSQHKQQHNRQHKQQQQQQTRLLQILE